MCRVLCSSLVLLVAFGCALPPERMPLQLLPENSAPLPYSELLTRARLQASAATEAFYLNRWGDLEDSARGLLQTARFFPKATEVPSTHKANLGSEASALEKDAQQLLASARAQDVKETTSLMQRINLQVRELRLDK
jgi:hypothetical protein